MDYTTNLNYVNIQQETMIHYGKDTPEIKTYADYTNFMSSADATKIF